MSKKYLINGIEIDRDLFLVLKDHGVLDSFKTEEDPMGMRTYAVLDYLKEIDDWNKRYSQCAIDHSLEMEKQAKAFSDKEDLTLVQKETISAQRDTIAAQKEHIKSLKRNVR